MFRDIKSYIRKDSLERDIRATIEREVDGSVSIGDIYVIGSWATGQANIGRSDIDVIFLVSNCKPNSSMEMKYTRTANPCSEQLFDKTMLGEIELSGFHPKISGIDLIAVSDKQELRNDLGVFMDKSESHRAYNLTTKSVVSVEDLDSI